MKPTVWLVRVSGETTHQERFCFDRKQVGQAFLELCYGGPSGDSVIDEQTAAHVDEMLQVFNDANGWVHGMWQWVGGGFSRTWPRPAGFTLEAFIIDPKQIQRLVGQVAEQWLGAC